MWLEQDIRVWNDQLGTVCSRKESRFNKTPEQVNEATGTTCHFLGAFHSCMSHSSPWRVSFNPNPKLRGCIMAALWQFMCNWQKTRSKSCILPWEQKWWANGGVNSPALSYLWGISISENFPLVWKGLLHWVTRLLQNILLFPWCFSGRDQSNQHPVLPQYYRSSGHCAEKTSPFPVSVFSDVQNYS